MIQVKELQRMQMERLYLPTRAFPVTVKRETFFYFFIYVTFESRLVELLEFIKNPDISLISLGGHQQL